MGHSDAPHHVDPPIELIARALIRSGDRVLVCQNRKRGHRFLPGGHVDPGEPAAVALARELREEARLDARVGALLFVNEGLFTEPDGSEHHELNLVFHVEPLEPLGDDPPESAEDHIRFVWWEPGPDAHPLLPAPMDEWLRSRPSLQDPIRWVEHPSG